MRLYSKSNGTTDTTKQKIVEANIKRFYELSPSNSKSFYGKAKVAQFDDGSYGLYSYDTLVSTAKDGKVTHLGKFSQTTSRHQKEFEKQFSESASSNKKKVSESRKRGKGINILKESYDDYNYYDAVKGAIREAFEREYYKEIIDNATDRDDAYEELYDEFWNDDDVTGNSSGSYTMNAYRAEENLCHNLDLLCEAIEAFGGEPSEYKRCLESPEIADVTIRCYVLGSALSEVLDEYDFNEE